MAIQTPISTVSYNTEPFLREKLQELLKAHKIQAYQYIKHKGEGGDKDHIHLRIEPNTRLDPMDLTEMLKEYPSGCDKPLGVRPWRNSKEEDFYLYVVHDKDYLELKYGGGDKGEKIPYDFHDIQVSEDYDLETAFIRAKASMKHTSANLVKRLRSGELPMNLMMEGESPFMVNAMVHALHNNEYTNLRNELEALTNKYMQLVQAIKLAGMDIEEDENGKITIV